EILERIGEGHVLLAENRIFAELHDHRGLRGELLGPLRDGAVELPDRDDTIDDPDPLGLLRRELLAEQQQLIDLLARHVAIDERHDHERKGPDVYLRRTEANALTRDHQVACKREAQSTGEHMTAGRAERR